MPDLTVPWGEQQLDITLPDAWSLEQVAEPALRPAEANWVDRVSMALAQPGSGPPLGDLLGDHRQGRVAIVVEDITRHSPVQQLLGPVLREIQHAGIEDRQVELVFATGMHPAMTEAEAREKIGPLADRLSWRSNAWDDRSAQVHVGRVNGTPIGIDRGVAEADLRILISSVSPHLQAGFGGGYKMLIPGCAALETIRALHRKGVQRGFRQLVGLGAEQNPMRAFLDAAGEKVDAHHGQTFSLQYLLDGQERPSYIAAGEVATAQRMLAKQCAVACGVVVPTAADVLIANAYPRDVDLWQCFKCIPNTLWAARPGGIIICLARCPAGMHGMEFPSVPLSPTWVRRLLRLIGADGLCSLITRLAPSLAGDAAFFIRMATQTLYRNPIYMVSPALHAAGAAIPGLHLFASPAEAIQAAENALGQGPQKVVAFPSGGITYPVPPAAENRQG